jgi:hypothetical protein
MLSRKRAVCTEDVYRSKIDVLELDIIPKLVANGTIPAITPVGLTPAMLCSAIDALQERQHSYSYIRGLVAAIQWKGLQPGYEVMYGNSVRASVRRKIDELAQKMGQRVKAGPAEGGVTPHGRRVVRDGGQEYSGLPWILGMLAAKEWRPDDDAR